MFILEGVILAILGVVLYAALLFIMFLSISLAWNYGKYFIIDKFYENMDEF